MTYDNKIILFMLKTLNLTLIPIDWGCFNISLKMSLWNIELWILSMNNNNM